MSGDVQELENRPGAYVLCGCRPNYLYKGSARNVATRVADHCAGRVARTRHLRPLMVMYVEYTDDFTLARQRENWLKSGVGRAWLLDHVAARVAKWQTQGT
jgi:predicted GIY-YIG superfamily endonuclease